MKEHHVLKLCILRHTYLCVVQHLVCLIVFLILGLNLNIANST